MSKDDRSAVNPFTGKKHFDILNDDQFLEQCYQEYYNTINQSQLLDNTPEGQMVNRVIGRLVSTVEDYLRKIGRYDYVEDYYDWEVHLIANDIANAFCMPGGKIVVYSGILPIANNEESLAFILGHEISHALLDHSRTQMSQRKVKNGITQAARLGGIGLSLFGLGAIGNLTYDLANVADIGSEYAILQPHGRDQELEADKLGITLIYLAGYNINGIPAFWQRMSEENSNNFDLFSTHPADSKRIKAMNEIIQMVANRRDFYSAPILSQNYNTIDSQNNIPIENHNMNNLPPHVEKISQNRKICINCGKISTNINTNFCTECGNQLELELHCSNCGTRVHANSVFCTNCGSKFS